MRRLLPIVLALGFAACTSPSGPQTGSQTNWLIRCDSSNECAPGVECVCGACTRSCASETACGDLPGTSCVASNDVGSVALCSGEAPPTGLCLPRCDDVSCAAGTTCLAGVCVPALDSTVHVTLDTTKRHQALVGFGASLAYADEQIVAHPNKAALYDLLFADSGFDAIRLRNRYLDPDEAAVQAGSEIVDEASARIGRTPFLFMSSGTPPETLKANGSRVCGGDDDTCTLVTLPGGGFDYAGFASWWRSSLDAYANAGVTPDYISIQNNPNWNPPAEVKLDACRFLPVEGMTTVTVDGTAVNVTFPGYDQALDAVKAAIASLAVVPKIGAPETGVIGSSEFAPPLGASDLDALAVHLYGLDPANVDVALLQDLRARAAALGRPVFQTEMLADGSETAILAHHALVNADATVYLHNDFAATTADNASVSLTLLSDDAFEAQGPYYALSHYAKHTDPGWVRVDAVSDSSGLLSSAWLAPDSSALTVVLVNPGTEELVVELEMPAALRSDLAESEITRTVFDGIERATALGELPSNGVVRVPGGSIVTVALASP